MQYCVTVPTVPCSCLVMLICYGAWGVITFNIICYIKCSARWRTILLGSIAMFTCEIRINCYGTCNLTSV